MCNIQGSQLGVGSYIGLSGHGTIDEYMRLDTHEDQLAFQKEHAAFWIVVNPDSSMERWYLSESFVRTGPHLIVLHGEDPDKDPPQCEAWVREFERGRGKLECHAIQAEISRIDAVEG
ncbi:MAG: hypothetical protein AAF533_17720 [Acidobacteriota bacterium]